jgi:hypothetical protein
VHFGFAEKSEKFRTENERAVYGIKMCANKNSKTTENALNTAI